MTRPKRAAAQSGAQRTRAHLQPERIAGNVMTEEHARAESMRPAFTGSGTNRRRGASKRAMSKAGAVGEAPMRQEVETEPNVMSILATTLDDGENDQQQPLAGKTKRKRAAKAVEIKQEDAEELDGQTDGAAKGRRKKGNAAVKAEQRDGKEGPAVPLKKRMRAQRAEKQLGQGTLTEEATRGTPKRGRQRKGEVSQQAKTEMPELGAQQGVREKAAAAPRRRKSQKRDDAGMAPFSCSWSLCMDITGTLSAWGAEDVYADQQAVCNLPYMVYEAVLRMLTGKDTGDIQTGAGSCRAEECLAMSRSHACCSVCFTHCFCYTHRVGHA